jgi:hypothetical protein
VKQKLKEEGSKGLQANRLNKVSQNNLDSGVRKAAGRNGVRMDDGVRM